MRKLRSIRDMRYRRRRSSLRRLLFFVLIGVVAAGVGITSIRSKMKTKSSATDLIPGKIYTQENKQKGEDLSSNGDRTSGSEESKEESPTNPESFTFYKVLNSKEGDIVPLIGDTPKPIKKEEGEIKTPQDEKMVQIEKEIDKNIERKIRRDDVYTVQVAAFSNESTANEIMSKLKLQGYAPSIIKEDEQRGKRLYKIRVGRFSSIVDAQEVAKVLKKDGYDTYVIKAPTD